MKYIPGFIQILPESLACPTTPAIHSYDLLCISSLLATL